jgi:outer membrane protein assembly factor BamD
MTRAVITRTPTRHLVVLAVCAAALGVAGCHRGLSKKEEARMSNPEAIYERAHKELDNSNYEPAIRLYEALEARYPFSDSARQARLDLMYAYYKNREAESAVDAADLFIRENPTHPRCDYAYYIKGLVYFEETPNFIERFFRVDLTERPPVDGLKSFSAFQTLLQQYPRSIYAHDAERRMVYLRNRLANYEVEIANYYMRRGAYVAALNRAEYAIEHYDGAPSVRRALEIMVRAYRKMELPDLADRAEAVYHENFPDRELPANKERRKSWWKFWG